MTEFPLRDITGKCEGECKNIVLEADEKRQKEIDASSVEYDGPSPGVPWAKNRNETPGFFGGHV